MDKKRAITHIQVGGVLYQWAQETLYCVMKTHIILKHDRHKKLLTYQKSLIIYQITVIFCNRFLNRRDPTVGQMIQSAHSSKQNIMDGCTNIGVSRETEIQRIGTAHSKLDQLLEDFQDYLRTHRSRIWANDSPEVVHMRKIGRGLPKSESAILELVRTRKAPAVCNMSICLIHQTNYLLHQQLRQLDGNCVSEADLGEQMYHVRRFAK